MQILVPTRPTTKKTSSSIVYKRVPTRKLPSGHCGACGRGSLPIVLPSDTYRLFEPVAVALLMKAWQGRAPLTGPVHVSAVFYREAARGDLVGFMQALADVLEKAGVVDNDRQIECWDGTRLDKDADRPRIELVIRELVVTAAEPAQQPLVLGDCEMIGQ